MSHRDLASLIAVVSLSGVIACTPPQTHTVSPDTPRTPAGRPDLTGVWDFRTVTPLERPSELADKEFLTDEEAAIFASERVQAADVDLNRATTVTARRVVNGTAETVDLAAAYNNFWYDRGTTVVGTRRTSLIIDPADGRIPALSEAAHERVATRVRLGQRITEGPEDRSLGERCIVRPNAGPPMTPAGYNNNVQLFQTPDYVAIFTEQIHDARIVPLDGRPHLPQGVRQWMGDSRGHWEGDTLVIETTNFNDKKYFRGATDEMHLIERFTRVDPDTVIYEFTVTDPSTFEHAWSVQIPMRRNLDPIYEYACHEGNYGMEGTLSGARAIEQETSTGSG